MNMLNLVKKILYKLLITLVKLDIFEEMMPGLSHTPFNTIYFLEILIKLTKMSM